MLTCAGSEPEPGRSQPPSRGRSTALPGDGFARIAAMVAELQRHIADWQHWFAAQGIAPLRIEYDSLSADPTAKLARICAALGLAEAVAGSLHPGVAKRPDATTAVWIGRYRLDAAGQA